MLSDSQPRTHPLAALVGLAVVYLLAAIAVAYWPLGRTVGAEYTLVMTVITALAAPLAAAASGVPYLARDRRVWAEALTPLLLPTLLAPAATVVIFMLLPSCDPKASLLLYALGPPATMLLVIALVALLGWVVRRPFFAGLFAYVVILSSGALTLWRLYREPPTYFLNHFFGAYYGIIYDEVAGVDSRVLQFRGLTWLWALGGIFIVRSLIPNRGRKARRAPGWAAVCLIAAAALTWLWGDQLHPTREEIQLALGKRVTTPHFEIFLDRRTTDEHVAQIAEDHEFRYAQLKDQLGVVPQERVRSFVYPSAQRKGELIGARGTQLARPWQLEMHINDSRFPHPVLAHELVHVLAAPMGTGPLRVSSSMGVLWRPGLVEGLAVALEPDTRELPLMDRARALEELGHRPPVEELMELGGFEMEAPARAYVAAGALLRHLIDTHGLGQVSELYRTGDFSALAGATAEQIEEQWRSALGSQAASPEALAQMRRRFERAAIFDRRCAHARRGTFEEVRALYGDGKEDEAFALLAAVREESPEDIDAANLQFALGTDAGKLEEIEEAAAWLQANGDLTPVEIAEIEEARGDVTWRQGETKRACLAYLSPDLLPLRSHARRLLSVKRFACDWHRSADQAVAMAARGIMEYLVGRGATSVGKRADLLALQIHRDRLRDTSHPIAEAARGLLAYLIARQLVEDDAPRAALLLDDTLAAPSVDAELRVAAVEARGWARYFSGNLEGAASDFSAAASTDVRGAYARSARDALQRVQFDRKGPLPTQIDELSVE